MYSFVLTMFCLQVFAAVVRFFTIYTGEFPRMKEEKLSTEIIAFVINSGFAVWACFVLWG